ncbi:MAG: cytidylate kinase family protein [Spirochaetaceae bacterium]|jgi:cytidylate kinase|nr:cytidylate kinase family protein [Spirochaetaceae bacterium]
MKIAISGKSGCGNTTISRLVSEMLGLHFINFTFRNLALEKGLSLPEILALAQQDDTWDRELDKRQVLMAQQEKDCVLGSRLAIWMLPEADLKVYLRAQAKTRANRILNREGGTLEAVAAFTQERDFQDRERYLRIYQIDNDDYAVADLVIDTDTIAPEEIARRIIERASFPSCHS